jgi:hypothetical protein
MRLLILIFVGFIYSQVLSAQYMFPGNIEKPEDSISVAESDTVFILDSLNVKQDPRLENMLRWHIEINKKRDGIPGYRVEIFNSSAFNAREQAFKKKKEFLSKYGDYNVHVKYASPIFRVRVGDYRTKNEALKLHKQIQADYPGAFIVPDIIDFPLLKPDEI